MKRLSRLLRPARAAALLYVSAFASLCAQGPAVRLTQPITGGSATVLVNSRPPRSLGSTDLGALSPDTPVKGITLVFSRTAAQQTALDALLAAQANPASPQYHKWLTPESFAAQFGVDDADIATVENWLQAQGFSVDSVARSRDRISFSGSAAQVHQAFGTELHRYGAGSETHFAPSSDLSLPAALAPMVTAVLHLSDYRPRANLRFPVARPQYTSSVSGNNYLDPLDVATQYNVNPLYKSGYNGTGQSIAVIGQSWIDLTDVQHFHTALGISTTSNPTLVLMPGTGVSQISPGDEAESDLDVEYSSSMAPGANVYFVYTGNNPNYGAFDALTYAITEDIAPIVGVSYGDCELNFSPSDLNSFTSLASQANSQGQTVISAAGDDGSTTCYGITGLTTTQQQTPSVNVPSNLPTVTGIGGLQLAAGTYDVGTTQYFAAASGSDNYGSLLTYVPETVWNEDPLGNGISSGGGGTSVIVPRPSWQSGVPGIPAGNYRLEPDISLQASIGSPGYLLCTTDPTVDSSSCSNGLRDAAGDLNTAGGTSFGAPIFAGMLAVLEQAKNEPALGNVNPTLYALASSSTTYASAFHDITTGGNQCSAGTTYCSPAGAAVYAATTGYDEASGLGSLNLANLVAAWPSTGTSSLLATTVTVSTTTATIIGGASQQVTVTINAASGTTPPTGTVDLLLDGTVINSALPLTGGTATASYTAPTATGTHVLTAVYIGDGTYSHSTGTTTFNIGNPDATGTFTLAAANTTLLLNSSASTNVIVTPATGYTGTVGFTLTSSSSLSICYGINNAVAYQGGPVTTTLTLGEGTACTAAAARIGSGGMVMAKHTVVSRNSQPQNPWRRSSLPVALAGLLLGAFTLRGRSRRLQSLLGVLVLLTLGLGLSGCGSSNGATTTGGTTTGVQTITVSLTGTDTVNTAISNSTSFTLTVN